MPFAPAGPLRFFIAAACWLCGWLFGLVSVGSLLLSGKAVGGFLVVWLAGWTVGGVLAIYQLFRLLQPSTPQTLLVEYNGVQHDSGVPPFRTSFGFSGRSDERRSSSLSGFA